MVILKKLKTWSDLPAPPADSAKAGLSRLNNLIIILLIILLLPTVSANCQLPTANSHSNRIKIVIGAECALYTGTMFGLYSLWYKDYPLTNFHFFNDIDDWMKIDKLGHFNTGYYVSNLGYLSYKWAGIGQKKSALYGGLSSFLFLTSIECFDGFSENWGFSYGDFIANISGISLFISQETFWKEQRILIKFSYHDTPFADYRPEVFGKNFQQRILKDYNGQTYWLSCNIRSFLNNESKFPKWLNIAIGYSAEGMLGGSFNPPYNENGVPLPYFDRYSQFYLSPDIDLTKIKTKSKLINTIFQTLGFIKFPFSALEYNKDGLKGHWLYF